MTRERLRKAIGEATFRAPEPFVVANVDARAHTDPRAGDVRDSQADRSRVSALFPDLVPVALPEGLEATVEWFRADR